MATLIPKPPTLPKFKDNVLELNLRIVNLIPKMKRLMFTCYLTNKIITRLFVIEIGFSEALVDLYWALHLQSIWDNTKYVIQYIFVQIPTKDCQDIMVLLKSK